MPNPSVRHIGRCENFAVVFWLSADPISRCETMEYLRETYSSDQIKFDLPTQLYYTIVEQNIIKLVCYFIRKPD